MSTHAAIIVKTKTGYAGIYLHHDGYPEHTLHKLKAHYATPDAAAELVALGDISSLGDELGVKHDFDWLMKVPRGKDWREDPLWKMCNAYGRDRGETGIRAKRAKTIEAVAAKIDWEYLYVFDGVKWVNATKQYKN